MELSIIFLPLIASIISGFFGKYIGDRNSEIITSLLVSISALLSIFVLYQVIVNQYEENIVIATWISSGSLDVNWSMLIYPLSAVMLVVVTSVSALVHIYSIGYMSHDPHKTRFMTTNITEDKVSIFIDQLTINVPELIHVNNRIFSE